MGKAVRIGYAGIILEGIEGGIGEAAAVFYHRRYAEGCWQADHAPPQTKGGEVCNLVGADDGRRETTEVVIEIVEVAAGAAVDAQRADPAPGAHRRIRR